MWVGPGPMPARDAPAAMRAGGEGGGAPGWGGMGWGGEVSQVAEIGTDTSWTWPLAPFADLVDLQAHNGHPLALVCEVGRCDRVGDGRVRARSNMGQGRGVGGWG